MKIFLTLFTICICSSTKRLIFQNFQVAVLILEIFFFKIKEFWSVDWIFSYLDRVSNFPFQKELLPRRLVELGRKIHPVDFSWCLLPEILVRQHWPENNTGKDWATLPRKNMNLPYSIPQHDERKASCKRILHKFGISGLVTDFMQFHIPIWKKSDLGAPLRKITKNRFRK